MDGENRPLIDGDSATARMPQGPSSIPRASRGSMVLHSHVGSVVGSMGRHGFADFMKPGKAQITISSDGGSPGLHAVAIDDGDGGMLDTGVGSQPEFGRIIQEREDLLRDNGIIPRRQSMHHAASQALNSDVPSGSSSTPLASDTNNNNQNYSSTENPTTSDVEESWDEAVAKGKIDTSIKRELQVLVKNSAPLLVTFFLQYSLVIASIFSVGHLGKLELGAVSLASMTASVTGFALIQGMATCLDTLCAQSYGAGRPELVGMYFQKCVLLTLVCFAPVCVLWFNSSRVLTMLLPAGEERLIELAAQYLKYVALGIPGYTLFECGKRFLQAQGIFHASTMVILICSPLNMFLNFVLVWDKKFGIGFIGAPLAVAITNTLMAIMLGLYVMFVDGKKCWNGFSMDVFKDWGTLIKLAIPGVIMVESEFLAFELMTFGSSHLSTEALAAQTVLSSLITLLYELPFALSIAVSTRVANFAGAGLVKPAILTANVARGMAISLVVFDSIILFIFRYPIARLFSSDEGVIEQSVSIFGLLAALHIFDGLCGVMGGVLRGQGRQKIGGYINIVAYYVIGIPAAFAMAFPLGLGLKGLWEGLSFGLMTACLTANVMVQYSDWDAVVAAAKLRTDSA